MSYRFAAFGLALLLGVPCGLGCGKSKFDATLDSYNAWVKHSKTVSTTYNHMAGVGVPGQFQMPDIVLPGMARPGPKRPSDYADSEIASIEKAVNEFTLPDRERADPRMVQAIDGHIAIEKELIEALRSANAVIRAPEGANLNEAYLTRVNDSIGKLNGVVNRLSAESNTLEQLIRKIADESGKKLQQ